MKNYSDKRGICLASACLVGLHCRYDGAEKPSEAIRSLFMKGLVIPVCPEQLGGLPTPRKESGIVSGTGDDVLEGNARVLDCDGNDVTEHFVRGALEVVSLARMLRVERAYMKKRSPSCGFGAIYDGHRLVEGNGVCTAALLRERVEISPVD